MARNNSSPVQQFRGTTVQHNTYTGLPGELTVDTDKHVVVVHDGSTAGGHPTVPDKFLLKSTGGILTFNDGAEAPLQGDSIEVEINLTALKEALGGGGSLTAGEGITITKEGVIQVDRKWLGQNISTTNSAYYFSLYFTTGKEVFHTVLAPEWSSVEIVKRESANVILPFPVMLHSEFGDDSILLSDSPQDLGVLKGKAVQLFLQGTSLQNTKVVVLVRFTA